MKLKLTGNNFLIILMIISSLFLFFNFDLYKTSDNYNLENIETSKCKTTYRNLENNFYQKDLELLDVEPEYKGISIFPEVKNILCIGKVIDYEITYYEKIDDIEYIKLRLYTMSGPKVLSYLKLLLLFSFINPLFFILKKHFEKKFIVLFFIYFLFISNYIFIVEFNILSFLSEVLFFVCLYLFIYSDDIFSKNIINKNHNLAIDSLRALAVIFVILNHLEFSLFSSGYLGVDLFFVISGYVITKKYFALNYKNFKEFFGEFLFFRVKRILPVLIFFISITSIFVFLLDYYYKETLLVGLFSSIAVSNIYLFLTSSDYFAAESSLNAFTHTWSLGVEEQFYIIFPFLLFLMKRKSSNKNIFNILILVSFILFWIYQPNYQDATYYLLPFRFWQIGLGCLAAIYSKEIYNFTKKIPINLIFILLLATFFINIPYSKYLTTLNGVLAFLLINMVGENSQSLKILNTKKLATIGALSYSLYLWHWPVVALSKWASYENFNTELKLIVIVLLSFISFKFVEQPFRKTTLEKKKIMTSSILFSIILLTFSMNYVIENTQRNNILSGKNPIVFSSTDYQNIINEISCYHPKDTKEAFSRCITYVENKTNVYLIGDSHSTNHFLSLENIFREKEKYNFSHLVDWSFIRTFQGIPDCGTFHCVENSFEKHINFYAENLREDDIVIISFSRDWFKEDGTLPRRNNDIKLKKFDKKLEELMITLKNKNSKVVFVGDIPKTCETGTNFINDIIKNGDIVKCTVEKTVSLKDREAITNIFMKYLGENIKFIDPHDYFCNDEYCSIIDLDTNKILFTDLSPHISKEGLNRMNDFWDKVFLTEPFKSL